MIANDNGVEEVSCTEAILDLIRMFAIVLADCMTTESKAEDECEGIDWNGDGVGKIGSGIESVRCSLGTLCYCSVNVVVGITDGL